MQVVRLLFFGRGQTWFEWCKWCTKNKAMAWCAMAQAWGVWAVCKSEQLDASRSQPDVSVRRSSHRKEDLPGCARKNHRRPDCGGKKGLNPSMYPLTYLRVFGLVVVRGVSKYTTDLTRLNHIPLISPDLCGWWFVPFCRVSPLKFLGKLFLVCWLLAVKALTERKLQFVAFWQKNYRA